MKIEDIDSSFCVTVIKISKSSTKRIAIILNTEKETAEIKYTTITCDCRYYRITQLIAMKMGEAAPLPCTAPCNGRFDSPVFNRVESPYAVLLKCFILQRVLIIYAAMFG